MATINEEDKRTEKRSIEKVIEHWGKTPRTALNCLDIENRIGHCCPLPIIASDLLEQTARHAKTCIGYQQTWATYQIRMMSWYLPNK
jgi:hypothetical protein